MFIIYLLFINHKKNSFLFNVCEIKALVLKNTSLERIVGPNNDESTEIDLYLWIGHSKTSII